ncbi:MAG: DNA repair protein RadC [Bacteroidales bacterium]|jgi:DNA repair protein RadC|nr:DNA repair protein RadC [Bacteroidales bacterium]
MKKKSSPNLTIKDWNILDRPREKYLSKGFQSLSNAELLSLIVRNGSTHESAVEVCRKLLAKNSNNLDLLADCNTKEMMQVNGIGEVKAIAIQAAFELGNRRRAEKVLAHKKIKYPTEVVELMQDKIAHLKHEEFWAIFLNNSSIILGIDNFGKGSVGFTTVNISHLIKKGLDYNATGIILCHNHPSGDTRPSKQDLQLTINIKEAAHLLGINVIDHLILYKETFYSFNTEGQL